jgi:hypothetical protein
MKRAVSISIGSSQRDKAVEVELLGERVQIERIGTDGDMEKAALLYKELDGKVDAFGVGGADLGVMVADKWYPLYSVQPMVRYVNQTPIVDGAGLKNTLENHVAPFMESQIKPYLDEVGRKAFITLGVDRWGMTKSFLDGGYECVFGDIMFGLGLPIPVRSEKSLKILASILMPIVGRVPFEWVYPTGEKQESRDPKWEEYYQWATVIAGSDDVKLFKEAGCKYLVTSTPVLEGRSFGVNMMEAALVAVSGKGRKLTRQELNQLLDQLDLEPQLREL